MELSSSLAAIKQQISQGNLEEAYDQLVKLTDAYAHYAELADVARVNQADLYQLKAQTLKGTISPEDARIAANQLTNNALQVLRHLETGKVNLEKDIQPNSSKAWRYYLVGGIVTLAVAILLWQLLGKGTTTAEPDACPVFSKDAELRVLVLPFKQTGKEKDVKPEFDIMDGLNDLIEKTPGLRVRSIADVYENYDIDKDYPNSAQAAEIAQYCQAQMLIWGKVNQNSATDYTVDVRYRLLDAGGVRFAGDTTISRLLTVTEEASFSRDVKAITNLLYLVLANQMRVTIAANVLDEINAGNGTVAALKSDSLPQVDTSRSLILADYYIRKNQNDQAIAEYNKVLEFDPSNATALKKRGALLLEKQDYPAAARDLESVSLHEGDKSAAPALREARIKAYLKSGQPDKAQHEVESAKKEGSIEGSKWKKKNQEVQDSLTALQVRRDNMERLAAAKPKDAGAHLNAAKANLGLGDTRRALDLSKEVLQRDPKNIEAVQLAADAHLQRGDTVNAVKTIETAERAGVNVKSIKLAPIQKSKLLERKQ
ncbi:MAG: tetratricopeptide repeat protein [Saprospiraceae bacterium]|nr:tetratricopeptide repeat protein [Saprospiraceae bacterium]